MITIYETNKTLTIYSSNDIENIYDKIKQKCWIHLSNPTEEEIKKVQEITKIAEDMIRAPLDEEETAHIDIDGDDTLLVVDTPIIEDEEDFPEIKKYSTMPFGIMYNNDYFITVCIKNTPNENLLNSRLMRNISTNKHIKLTIQLLYRNASRFVTTLKLLDKDSQLVQKKLHESMKNKELFELMSLGKSLVYLSTGINADYLVLEKIKRLESFKKFEEDIDLIEDAIIENRQAMEMCNIHRDILNGTMDAFASVISNNVNTVMKTLTVVTIVLTIPTLVASFFGMNVDLPIHKNGFIYALIISIFLSSIGAFFLVRYTSKIKSKKKK